MMKVEFTEEELIFIERIMNEISRSHSYKDVMNANVAESILEKVRKM